MDGRLKDLRKKVTQWRKDHSLTPGTCGGWMAQQLASLQGRVEVLVSDILILLMLHSYRHYGLGRDIETWSFQGQHIA